MIRLLNTKSTHAIIGTLLVLGVALCVFTPNYVYLKWGANYAVHIMFGYLGMGLLFLALRQPKLVFTSFACCAVLCFFLKKSSNTDIIHPIPTSAPTLNVAHFNMSATNGDVTSTVKSIQNSKADILSLQEVTPDWGAIIKESLQEEYPFNYTIYRPEDFLGISVYSRVPTNKVDTFYYNDIPNLAVSITGDKGQVHFISSYIYPELSNIDAETTEGHFDTLTRYIEKLEGPVFSLGEYNQVQWSSYIQNMRSMMDLQDSRRFPFFDNPTDHIFHSHHFKCVDFTTISNAYSNHLGIKGSYQINENFTNAQKTALKF